MTRRAVLQGLTLLVCVAGSAAGQKLVPFSGTVVDSVKQPIANAEVSIAGMNLSKTTDDKGFFRIETVSAGVHQVTVRRIGFAQLDTTIVFPEDQEIVWRVTMTARLVTLDSMIVRAPIDPLMVEFEANRKRGFGRFRTREELAKMDGVSLQNVLRGLQGADIIRTNSTAAYITSKRAPSSACNPPRGSANPREALQQQEAIDECLRRERVYYVPDISERRQGVARACYPLGYVDRQLMNPGRPTPPFDIGQYPTDAIEAIEWYESEAQTPPKYSINSPHCGVLVLHLRKRK